MIITIPWLKEHLKTSAKESEIINQLTNIGLEVEGIKESSGEMGKFKIAKVLKTEKHPNADKLKVCDVTIGGKEILKVVCGAPNVREGLITIYAPPGVVIPKTNFELKVVKIRGVESRGMLCSESELNLSNESEGIVELKNKEKDIGKNYFKSSSQKGIDISITPNRADCLGIKGIARDLSSAGVGKLIESKRKKIKQETKQQFQRKKIKGVIFLEAVTLKILKIRKALNGLKIN
jgi:phenylalanyl-tRNA synthetase beta chain